MKFHPHFWREVKPNETFQAFQGLLRVRCAPGAALFLDCQGVEALVGFDTSFEVEISEEMTAKVTAFEKQTRVFVFVPEQTSVVDSGEIFTNIDRMPHESGSVLEVRRALRELELEKRAAMREIRAERAVLNASRPKPAADFDKADLIEPDKVSE